jgi:hypothetical protein
MVMRTASCLTLIAIGAILTFAVSGSPGWLNIQVAGVVIMVTWIAGLFIRRPSQGWLRRRTVLRDRRRRVVGQVSETRYPPYVTLNPGASPGNGHHGHQPGDLTSPAPADDTTPDLAAGDPVPDQDGAPGLADPAPTEVVEEYIEE